MANQWEVVVGNLGAVYRGSNGFEAIKQFNEYRHGSKIQYGRIANEPVTLMRNGEVHSDYAVPDRGARVSGWNKG
jgi:hypothetical protein